LRSKYLRPNKKKGCEAGVQHRRNGEGADEQSFRAYYGCGQYGAEQVQADEEP
jgi:hypothetical protein